MLVRLLFHSTVYAVVISGIAYRFLSAITLSVYNKWMFSPERYGFHWPLFVTSFHMFAQFFLAAIVRKVWARKFKPPFNPTRKDYVSVVMIN